MKAQAACWSGLCLAALLLLPGCGKSAPEADRGAIEEETQYLIQRILEELVVMTRFAKDGQAVSRPGDLVQVWEGEAAAWGKPDYRVRLRATGQGKGEIRPLPLNQPVWEPAVYDAALATLCRQAGVDPKALAARGGGTEAAAQTNLLELLLACDAESLHRAGEQVAAELTARPGHPGAHERAALVLGVFALREACGAFYDVRVPLCRMTAHLAWARAGRGEQPAGPEGQVADVLLYALMGNQTDALGRLEKIAETPLTRPWRRAVRAWITGDYRDLDGATDRTPLELVCWFAAGARSVSAHAAWEKLPEDRAAARVDFCRLAQQRGVNVEVGHQVYALSPKLERAEIARVFRLHGRPLPGLAELAPALNLEPGHGVEAGPDGTARVRVLDWGLWAQFLQRHLCHSLHENHRFLKSVWGVTEEAAAFARDADNTFKELRLYPFVQRLRADQQAGYRAAAEACGEVIRRWPHLVPVALWNLMYSQPAGLERHLPPDLPDIRLWHRHNPPPHTVYRAAERFRLFRLTPPAEVLPLVETLHRLAPYNLEVAQTRLHYQYGDYGRGQPPNVIEAAYGPLLDYSVTALWAAARAVEKDPEAYERLLARAAEREAYYYFTLGRYFVERGDEARALKYHELGVQRCTDAVGVANNVHWLVRYYFRNNRLDEARKLADFAARVYSAEGLQTKGDLHFWLREYAESFEYYRRIEERYNNTRAVFNWWLSYREQTGRDDYDAEINQRLAWLFPRGRQAVSLAELEDPPRAGVEIREENDRVRAAGLKKGDVIVGLGGQRVDTLEQYQYLRVFLPDDTLRLLVWDGTRYREVTASPPQRRFGVQFETYRPE
jgi:tetratricopeptide (TPR) repeat protein